MGVSPHDDTKLDVARHASAGGEAGEGGGGSVSPVSVGEIVAGKYEILRVVASGAMGVVVAARHLELGHNVALKFLLRASFSEPDAIPRFLREARAVVQMKSEHVVRVSDVGTLPSGDPFLVMELLEGCDLKEVVERDGPLPVARACDYVIQAAEALAEAHTAGVVHRDIKPANIFVTARADGSPLVKVLDFGIAKTSDPMRLAGGAATATNAVMGSPLYMSPEQVVSAKNVDARSDVWALGVTLYELLTGHTAFVGGSFGELFNAILNHPHRPAVELRPDLPPEIEVALARCLEKDPAKRLQSVAELAGILAPFAPASAATEVERITKLVGAPSRSPAVAPSNPPVASTPLAPVQPSGISPTAQTGGAWGRTGGVPSLEPKRSRTVFGLVAVALALVAYGFYQRAQPMSSTSSPVASSLASGPAAAKQEEPAPVNVKGPLADAAAESAAIAATAPSPSAAHRAIAAAPAKVAAPLPSATAQATNAPKPSATRAATPPAEPKKNPINMDLQ